MEFSSKWDVNMLMNELIQGMDQAQQLKLHLSSFSTSPSSFQAQDLLLQRVMSSFDNALLMLQSLPGVPLDSGVVESSSVSMNTSYNGGAGGNPSDTCKQVYMDNQNLKSSTPSKKRKAMQTWTEQVKVSAEHGLEGPVHDGFSWRKYGQKPILGAKFPRSYYRCTYSALRNCGALKQVQRSDEFPTVFDITYKGFHTCTQSATATDAATNTLPLPLPPPSEKTDQPIQTNVNINHLTAQLLMNFQSNTLEATHRSSNKDADFSFLFPSSWTTIAEPASYYSPIMPESNYYSASSCNDNLQTEISFIERYESELHDIISSNTSATTSLRLSGDSVELDPKFLCDDISDFLSCLESPKQRYTHGRN